MADRGASCPTVSLPRSPGRPIGSVDRSGRAVRAQVQHRRSPRWLAFCRALGAQLRRCRESRNIAATELAAAIGAHVQTVWIWERGRQAPCLPMLVAIAAALGCSLADLLPDADALGGPL